MYQGHVSDGSSIQKHSAGATYPFVVFAKDTAAGLLWGVQAPNGQCVYPAASAEQAVDAAVRYATAYAQAKANH